MKTLLTAVAVLLAMPAMAQTPATTAGSNNASGTITTLNVFQTVFAANPKRKGCFIQNQATTNMSVSEGIPLATPPTPAKSFTLFNTGVVGPYNAFFCQIGSSVLTGEIDITGAAGAAFYAIQW